MPTLGKSVWGGKGKGFDIVQDIQLMLEQETGQDVEHTESDYERRSYTNKLVVSGTPVTFTYNSSMPGYGTLRWNKSGGGHQKIVDAVLAASSRYDIPQDRILKAV